MFVYGSFSLSLVLSASFSSRHFLLCALLCTLFSCESDGNLVLFMFWWEIESRSYTPSASTAIHKWMQNPPSLFPHTHTYIYPNVHTIFTVHSSGTRRCREIPMCESVYRCRWDLVSTFNYTHQRFVFSFIGTAHLPWNISVSIHFLM